jgi:hypothetical protein
VRTALARADGALRTAPPQARAARADAVARLRDALVRSLGAGAEQALAAVAHLADDGVWLAAAAAALHEVCTPTADAFADTSGGPDMRGGGPHLVALVLLLP